jgi:hypothetical protein
MKTYEAPQLKFQGQEDCYDEVDKVAHYQMFPDDNIEVRQIINRAIQLNIERPDQAYPYGNVLKYLLRCGRKRDGLVQDLKKAENYLRFLIEQVENSEEGGLDNILCTYK